MEFLHIAIAFMEKTMTALRVLLYLLSAAIMLLFAIYLFGCAPYPGPKGEPWNSINDQAQGG